MKADLKAQSDYMKNLMGEQIDQMERAMNPGEVDPIDLISLI